MKNIENKIDNARKNIWKAGMMSHFGGEFILLGGMIGSLITPLITEINFIDLVNLQLIGKGALAYLVLQPPAFFLKGLAMNKEENYLMAKDLEESSCREKGLLFPKFEKGLSKMHNYFAENSEIYDNLITLKFSALV